MSRYAYVNGRYVPHSKAAVHIEDRGYQFADGIYEVITVYNGTLVDEEPHLDRLERSLAELKIDMPVSRAVLKQIAREMIRRNLVMRGIVYMQITRGVARRDHKFPATAKPSLVMTARQMKPHGAAMLNEGVGVITVPDLRWARCDIKSVSLLPNVLAKQEAAEAGCYEAWQVDPQGYVTEGTSSNAWIVTGDGRVITRGLSHAILSGITRKRLLRIIAESGHELEERAFTVDEAKQAKEAFVTSSTSFVMPVTRIDDAPVGNGHPGILCAKLRDAYIEFMAGLKESA